MIRQAVCDADFGALILFSNGVFECSTKLHYSINHSDVELIDQQPQFDEIVILLEHYCFG
uniref:Uncharacterized protein n=1 Tax=Arundo donax TaxID=35708 RepID=A0A0A9D839_ARUDO